MKNGIVFQEQRTSNDVFFVFSALMKAQRISLIDKVMVHQRKQSGSLQGTRSKSWQCILNARLKLMNQLKAWNYWPFLEQDFVNHVAFILLWNLRTLRDETRKAFYDRLTTEYFSITGIADKPKAYFYYPEEYDEILRIITTDAQAYLQLPTKTEISGRNELVAAFVLCNKCNDRLKQTIQCLKAEENAEIILAAIGSSEPDFAELKRYACESEGIRLISLDNEKKLFACFAGSDRKYAIVLKAGDRLKKDTIPHLVETAENNSCDVVLMDYYRVLYDQKGNACEAQLCRASRNRTLYGEVIGDNSEIALQSEECRGLFRLKWLICSDIGIEDIWSFKTAAQSERICLSALPGYLAFERMPEEKKSGCFKSMYLSVRRFTDKRIRPVFRYVREHGILYTIGRVFREIRIRMKK